MRTASLWRRDRLSVEASVRADGSVLIEGQDLRGEDELDYDVTVPACVPALVAAGGETRWLRAHGVEFSLETW